MKLNKKTLSLVGAVAALFATSASADIYNPTYTGDLSALDSSLEDILSYADGSTDTNDLIDANLDQTGAAIWSATDGSSQSYLVSLASGYGKLGIYSFATGQEVSLDFTREKLINMREEGIDAIVVCCPFCHLQFDIGQVEVNNIFKDQIRVPFNIPVIYVTQLLGLAMGLDPYRMGLLKTPHVKGVPPMQAFESLFTKYQKLDLLKTTLFSPTK